MVPVDLQLAGPCVSKTVEDSEACQRRRFRRLRPVSPPVGSVLGWERASTAVGQTTGPHSAGLSGRKSTQGDRAGERRRVGDLMSSSLLVISASFPFGDRADFLEDEITWLSSTFDRVVLLPLVPKGEIQSTPANVEVDLSLARRLGGRVQRVQTMRPRRR